jgi:hypothetical protein
MKTQTQNQKSEKRFRNVEVSNVEELREAINDGYGYFMQDDDGTYYAYDGDFINVNPRYVSEGKGNERFMGCPIEFAEKLFFA